MRASRSRQASQSKQGRRTNLALGALLITAVVTGLASNTIGVDWPLDFAILHGLAALAILALTPWKSVVVRRGLNRHRSGTWTSLLFLAVVFVTVVSGLLHTTGTIYRLGPLTVMQIHVGGGIVAAMLVVQHFLRHPVKPRRLDVDKRAFLRGGALAAGAGLLWLGWERTALAFDWQGVDRRFTGSHERGSGDPAALPVTSWFDDHVPDVEGWQLAVGQRQWSLEELSELPHDRVEALLDCTGGWYSKQTWSGISLTHLIEAGDWRSLEVRSATGYARRFPIRDLDRLLLATHLGDSPLSPGHGYPARLVAPDRRGFWWVKWVVSVQPSHRPWWVQSPFPLT